MEAAPVTTGGCKNLLPTWSCLHTIWRL
jgi:hypothetical protein